MNRLCIVALFLTVVATVSISQDRDLDFNRRVTAIETEIDFGILLNEALYSLVEPRRHHPSWPEYGYDLSTVTEDTLCYSLNKRRGDFPIGDAALMYGSDNQTYVGFMLPPYKNENDRTLSELCQLIAQDLNTLVDEYESYHELDLVNEWYLVTELSMPTNLQPDIRVQMLRKGASVAMDEWPAASVLSGGR